MKINIKCVLNTLVFLLFHISSKIKINFSYKINNQITAKSVRLIGNDGSALGVVSLRDALQKAVDSGYDLIEISPAAEPPVCKIADYGKMRYEMQKKEIEKRKNTKKVETKEIRMGINIDQHDFLIKVNHAREFITEGNKVKFLMILRGRQNHHKDLAQEIFDKVVTSLEDIAKADSPPTNAGNKIFMSISPKL